jgi:spore coat protein U-like protein
MEEQHGSFPSPLTIETQSAADQTFPYSTDELVRCTNGVVFTVNVSSANGTANNQPCTSSGVGSMALKSASWPSDTIPYTFMCAGDTNGNGNFTGAGFAATKALGISIKVAAANAQAAMAHADYSDTVTLTLTY